MVTRVDRLEPDWKWIDRAQKAGKTVKSFSKWEVRTWGPSPTGKSTKHYVYAVLLYYPEFPHHPDRFGIYVGMSHLRPPQRLRNHRIGNQANEDVRRYGVRLLQHVYQHLNPMRLQEAKLKERELYDVLKASELGWVSMGHLRPPPVPAI
ncbi:hypothetical protein OHD62_06535 [Mesorhizobium sp. YC-39]|uniref:hypothetical protein n=1 Tax=unclassified Mesorhizobium TaxID=325217 RepID=UPI0021E7DA60|nr:MULTISPECIES: hypothetical protein [unclassified Mesorhizobium]MCV3205579.1 hypothetical protein [Mesorhizobium sp. YC-2]MCV3228022.1 hypothetical protein [Mesorhizobium sp. YC-39]